MLPSFGKSARFWHLAHYSSKEFVIEPPKKWVAVNLSELWAYRDMLYFLTLRNVTAQYKQSILGPLWIIINPVGYTIVFTFVFGVVASVETNDIPYPIFNYTAMIAWTLYVGIIGSVTNSIASQNMIKKVYFPRLILPLVEVLVHFINFWLTFAVLIFFLLYYQVVPTANMLALPLLLLLTMGFGLGLGLFFAVLQVRSRDAAHFVAYMSRFLLYVTPVLYPREEFPEPFDQLALLNPMASVVEGFRWAILDNPAPPLLGILWAVLVTLGILWGGALFFRRNEQNFADIA